VKGGSHNDYDYVGGDPINSFDLDGTHKRKCRGVALHCRRHNAQHGVGNVVRGVTRVAHSYLRCRGRGCTALRHGSVYVSACFYACVGSLQAEAAGALPSVAMAAKAEGEDGEAVSASLRCMSQAAHRARVGASAPAVPKAFVAA
jgi:hypothetical protein